MTIPSELFSLKQWVFWRYEDRGGPKPTKVPYNPNTGAPASVTNVNDWGTYEQVYNGHAAGYSGIGIVATEADEYVYVDLDNPYADTVNGVVIEREPGDPQAESIRRSIEKIVEHLGSYTQWSPSGKGLRIIIRGKIPAGWRNRVGKFEFYDRDRYLTLTNNHVEGTPLTIEARQDQLEDVMRSLGLDKPHNEGEQYASQPQTREDVEVYGAICNSAVGAAFLRLHRGDSTGFASGSEADLALANYICYFTDNKEQAARIFRTSAHYEGRTKLHSRPDLVERAINKGFDQKPPPIDADALQATVDALRQAPAPQVGNDPQELLSLPPGLMGEVAQFIYQSAPRPMAEAALAATIGLMGGLAGRAFNTDSGLGLNQYVIMLARSGFGKDAIPSGISKLLAAVEQKVPSARTFIGPSHFASAQALKKQFGKDKGQSLSFVSVLHEFGKWLEVHCDLRANANEQMLIREVLTLYSKSGKGNDTGASVYSDKEKNVDSVSAPALSIIGESVPSSFYRACTPDAIQNGLIPRMFILEYKGKLPPLNMSGSHMKPSANLVGWLADFAYVCSHNNAQNAPTIVPLMPEAAKLLDNFRILCESKINDAPEDQSDIIDAVWSRAHAKALKLASLVAVGCNWHNPMVYAENAAWAIELARRDVQGLVGKFDSGELGDVAVGGASGNDRHKVVEGWFVKYIQSAPPAPSFKIPAGLHKNGVLPFRFLNKKAKEHRAFKNDRNKTSQVVLENTLAEMSRLGSLREVPCTDFLVQPHVVEDSTTKYYVMLRFESVAS